MRQSIIEADVPLPRMARAHVPRAVDPEIGSPTRPTRLRRLLFQPPPVVALLTLALYLPSAAQIVQLSPDVVEHVDVAWRLLDGQGYVLGIKAYHIGGREVVHDGLIHRSPLLTLIMAGLFWLGLDLHAVQVAHTLVGAVSVALTCSIGSNLFGRPVGLAAGVLAAANPWIFKVQIPLMTEALTCTLLLVAIRLLIGAVDKPTVRPFALAGLAFGLCYLARPPALFAILATVVATTWIATDRRRLMRPMMALAAGAALVMVPMTIFSLVTRGRLIYSGKTYLYAVTSDDAVIMQGFLNDIPTPVEFISTHLGFIAQTIAGLAVNYIRWTFLEWESLLVLLPGWPLALLALWHARYPSRAWIPLGAALSTYLFYVASWGTTQDRHLLPTALLLLSFGVDGLRRAGIGVLERLRPMASWLARGATPSILGGLFVGLIVLAWLPEFVEQYRGEFEYFGRQTRSRNDAGIEWTGPPRWVNDDDFKRVLTWTETSTGPDDVLAAGQPWPLGLFSRRPSLMATINLDETSIRRFIVEYRVSQFLVDGRDPQRRRYREYLDELEEEGVRATKLGAVTAYDVRALWR